MGINIEILLQNRKKKLFKDLKDNSLMILYSGNEIPISEDQYYDFSVNRNFYYLTNLDLKDVFFVVHKIKGNEYKEYLFLKECNDKVKKKFYGLEYTMACVLRDTKLSKNNIYITNEFNNKLSDLLNKYKIKEVYTDFKTNSLILNILNEIKFNGENNDIYKSIINLRNIKDQYEISCLKKAVIPTYNAFMSMPDIIKNSNYEYEVLNAFNCQMLNGGDRHLGFATIVASGINTMLLHYPKSESRLDRNTLLLCDAGASFKNYSCDVSRTFQISGKFSEKQKIIYDIVEKCNEYIISIVKPGITLDYLQECTIKYLSDECLKNKLISTRNELKKVYYHHVSHHIGLDVHDPCFNKILEPGNVISVEPGLYFRKLKIGVRIEDTILVTKNGSMNLTKSIPKKSNDIESMFLKIKY